MRPPPFKSPKSKIKACELHEPGWTAEARAALQKLLTDNAGQGLPVVFDFDNTVVYGDIGEAVLAVLTKTGRLRPENIPATLAPPFRNSEREVSLQSCVDITEYYESLLDCTGHGAADPTPLANGYAWAVEIMETLSPADIVEATRTAYSIGKPGARTLIDVTPGKTAYPAPYFYPQIAELVAELIRCGFDFWTVSASNAWSVRWMVLNGLNPLLRDRGVTEGVRPDQVIGVSTLMTDSSRRIWKDPLLARSNRSYTEFEPSTIERLQLTSRLHFPVPTYSGKVAWILDAIGRRPFLCAGDSPGDLPMLRFSENRLWIARLEKPAYQRELVRAIGGTGNAAWLVQPVRAKPPGWISDTADMREPPTAAISESLEVLSTLNK